VLQGERDAEVPAVLADAIRQAERESAALELDRDRDTLVPEAALHSAREPGPVRSRRKALKTGHPCQAVRRESPAARPSTTENVIGSRPCRERERRLAPTG